jgi:ribonuclease Z
MVKKINLSFLGTSGAVPTAKRNHTGILLTFEGENILIDCGEGIQRQFRKMKLNPCKITKILITHWHGDHVLGLPGLLQTLALSEYHKDLTIYGPVGTKKFFENIFNTFVFVNKFPLKIIEIDREGKFFENEDFYLESKKLFHNASCLGYCFFMKGERRIDKEKLKKTNLSEGPLLQKLKDEKDIIFEGKKYSFKNLTFKEEDKKICFILDTKYNENLISFVKNSNVLVCDATFEPGMEKFAEEHNHMSAKQSAELAKKSKSKKLILTHISERYDRKEDAVLKEISKIFHSPFLVQDFSVVGV